MSTCTRWLSAAFLVLLAGCQSKESKSPTTEEKNGEAVATLDGQTLVTVEQLEDQLREQSPFVRARYTDPSKKKEFLDNLVRFELLSREAAKEGFDKDPEVVKDMKKAMVQRLLRKNESRSQKTPFVSSSPGARRAICSRQGIPPRISRAARRFPKACIFG